MVELNLLISVIITSYNVEKYIEGAINSVFNQTYKPIELIVVDGGSIDGTINIVEKLAKKHNFIMEVSEDNYASGCRNIGVKLSHGGFIAFLDGDDEFYLDALDILYNSLPHGYHMVYGDFYRVNPLGIIISEHISKPYHPRRLNGNCFIHCGALLMRRELIDIVGEWDESLRTSEDIDYWYRIALADCRVAYVNRFIMKHRVWGGSISGRGRFKMDLTNVMNKYYDLFKRRFKE